MSPSRTFVSKRPRRCLMIMFPRAMVPLDLGLGHMVEMVRQVVAAIDGSHVHGCIILSPASSNFLVFAMFLWQNWVIFRKM